MNKKHYMIIFVGIALSMGLLFYTKNNQFSDKTALISNIEDQNSKKVEISPEQNKVKQNSMIHSKIKEMPPTEYVAWVKDKKQRVLLEIKEDGTKIYRKGNITITVMQDGNELYLPDEL